MQIKHKEIEIVQDKHKAITMRHKMKIKKCQTDAVTQKSTTKRCKSNRKICKLNAKSCQKSTTRCKTRRKMVPAERHKMATRGKTIMKGND